MIHGHEEITAVQLIEYIKKEKPINRTISTQMINTLEEINIFLKNKMIVKRKSKWKKV